MLRARVALLSAMFVGLIAIGCDFVIAQDAQTVLDTGRELQRIETEEIRPQLAALDHLRAEEISPRQDRIQDLWREIQTIERETVRPLEEQLDTPGPEGQSLAEKEAEFDTRFRDMNDEERMLEVEYQRLSRWFQDQEREMGAGRQATIRPIEHERDRLYQQLDELYRNGNRRLEHLYSEADEAYALLGNGPDESPDTDRLVERIETIQAEITEREAQLSARTGTVEEALDRLENEQVKVIQAVEDEREQLYQRLDEMYRIGHPRLNALYGELEKVHERLRTIAPDSPEVAQLVQRLEVLQTEIGDAEAQFQAQTEILEQQIYGTEDKLQQLFPAIDSERERIYERLDESYQSELPLIEALYAELEDLYVQLNSTPDGSSNFDRLAQHLEVLEAEITDREAQLSAETEILEQQLVGIEDDLQGLYPVGEEEFRTLQAEFETSMRRLEDRRYQLQQTRWALEDEMGIVYADFDSAARDLEDQLTAIRELEIRPIEDEIYEIELELEVLYREERALESELRQVSNRVNPMEQQIEAQLLDLLEAAIGTAVESDAGSDASAAR